ncbi:MAG: radical SAM protein [Kiritimatiellae bacterium]|nr:radical SAM protein [Kiritimatiellia bacterium]
MRVAIAYLPFESEKGVPLLSQNRQFQWFSRPTYIYPVVPAQMATLLKKEGHEVGWMDGIAFEWSRAEFDEKLKQFNPEIIVLETKTPVVKMHWVYIKELKASMPDVTVVLVGDHVTAMPEESFENSPVDYILTGGDYDFLVVNLLKATASGKLEESLLETGIYWRAGDEIKNTGKFVLDHDLNSIPWIDRDLSHWELYSEKNGNYRETPGTYIMAGRDCWHGKCTFCSWTTLYPTYRFRDAIDVVDEIGELIEKYGVKEIMDDTGSLPVGAWLRTFCHEMIKRGYNKRIRMDCNMRFGRLTYDDYVLMREAGFRLVLFGIESANQDTLDRLVKGVKVEDYVTGAENAARAGLDVHITIMFGYPWEHEAEIENTVNFARTLLRKGHAYTLQCTMMIPYPGTPLFKEMDEAGLLLTRDWDDYDMRMQVMKCEVLEEFTKDAIRRVYKGFMHPESIIRRLVTTRDLKADLKFYWRGFRSLIGHFQDFKD